MGFDYDKLYRTTPNALGDPSPVFVDFFRALPGGARVLDVGCGQGRDALFIARLGHEVVGVDISAGGIASLVADAQREGLKITGHAADIVGFAPDGAFDVVLLDRTLHMLPEPDRLDVLSSLLDHVRDGGRVLIADERKNIAAFKRRLAAHHAEWAIERDGRGCLFARRSG